MFKPTTCSYLLTHIRDLAKEMRSFTIWSVWVQYIQPTGDKHFIFEIMFQCLDSSTAEECFFQSVAALGNEADATLSHLSSRGNQNGKVKDAFADSRREQCCSRRNRWKTGWKSKASCVWMCAHESVPPPFVTEFQRLHIDTIQNPGNTVYILGHF